MNQHDRAIAQDLNYHRAQGDTVVLDTPEQIKHFQLLSIRGRLSLELKGLKFRKSTLAAVNRMFGQNFRTKKQAFDYIQSRLDEYDECEPHCGACKSENDGTA